jgi:hypothetical protein
LIAVVLAFGIAVSAQAIFPAPADTLAPFGRTPTPARIRFLDCSIMALGGEPGGGLVVLPDLFALVHRAPIILTAARNNVPAVYTPRHGIEVNAT